MKKVSGVLTAHARRARADVLRRVVCPALLASPRMASVAGADWVIDGGLIKTT
jgi:hypothetical protein